MPFGRALLEKFFCQSGVSSDKFVSSDECVSTRRTFVAEKEWTFEVRWTIVEVTGVSKWEILKKLL